MTPDAESGSGSPPLLQLAAAIIGGMGIALMVGAGVWWLYETIQQGITHNQLAEVGASLLVIGFALLMIDAVRRGEESKLFGGGGKDGFE